MERAKSELFDAALHKKYWGVVLVKRSIASGTCKFPEELWTGAPVNLSNLKIFGTPAMTHILKQKRRKWDPKSKSLIFVGLATETKGYRLIHPSNGKLEISRDIIMMCNPKDITMSLECNLSEPNIVSVGENDDLSKEIVSVGGTHWQRIIRGT